MKKIGMIGLGTMGLPMAKNLLAKSGLTVVGYDVNESKMESFRQSGGITEDSAANIAKVCQFIFLSLPSNKSVESTIRTILQNAREDAIIIDLSSTAPHILQDLYPMACAAGVQLVDSPVSGGERAAISGELVLMCGGDCEAVEAIRELLYCIGRRVTYMGPIGSGNIAKLANNMIVGCNILAMGEAFAFAQKAGIDPTVLFAAIKDGYAASTVLSEKAPKIIARDFRPSAKTILHQKDLSNAVELAAGMGVEIPFAALALEYMEQVGARNLGNEDHCACIKIIEERMGVVISGEK